MFATDKRQPLQTLAMKLGRPTTTPLLNFRLSRQISINRDNAAGRGSVFISWIRAPDIHHARLQAARTLRQSATHHPFPLSS
jgi:hypothetical protein